MRLQRDSYAPKSCAFDAANVQFLRAHLCKSHPVLQHQSHLAKDKISDLSSSEQEKSKDSMLACDGNLAIPIFISILWVSR